MAAKTKVVKQPHSKRKSRIAKVAPAVVTHEMIEKRAFEIWLRKNHVAHANNAPQNWLEAEAELRVASRK
jgi:hypothetical protein